ncbi:MAG TPA: hypothetical protein VGP94_16250 [Tepidisphaeraceae bacterium]|nr:hypothetical protein [Tepidisphaeraceae bacterium]
MPRRKKFLLAGWILVALGAVMWFLGVSYFTAATPPPKFLEWIVGASFCAWWAVGLAGLILLIIGYRSSIKPT